LGAPAQSGGRYLALVLSALVVPAAAWATWPVVGPAASLWAGLLIALHPRLLRTAEWIQPEHLTALLWLVFGGLLWRGRRRSAAALLAFAYLARPEALVLLPIWWLYEMTRERQTWRQMIAATTVTVALILPYLILLRTTSGEWMVSGKSEWAYQQAQVQVTSDRQPVSRQELNRMSADSRSLVEHLSSDPIGFLRGYGRRWVYLLDHLRNALGWPLLVLGLVGAGVHLRAKPYAARFYLPLLLLPCIPIVVVHARHVLPYLPTLLVAAVAAVHCAIRLAVGCMKARISR